MPCRINRARLWTGRLILEWHLHNASSFVTLTYNDENQPYGGTLVPSHPRRYIKALRKRGHRIRYFLVGEYGDVSARPHYHAIIFGLSPDCVDATEAWPYGFAAVLPVSREVCGYVTGYCLKKMTKGSDERLAGRHPEFARMSLRPGIGAPAIPDLAKVATSEGGARVVSETGDVVQEVRIGGRKYPLGRYLRDRLRVESGYPAETSEARKRNLGLKRQAELTPRGAIQKREQKRANVALSCEGRAKIQSSKRKL